MLWVSSHLVWSELMYSGRDATDSNLHSKNAENPAPVQTEKQNVSQLSCGETDGNCNPRYLQK